MIIVLTHESFYPDADAHVKALVEAVLQCDPSQRIAIKPHPRSDKADYYQAMFPRILFLDSKVSMELYLPLVKERATRVLYEYVDPIRGGRQGRGWPFDEPLTAMSLFALLEDVDGVERVDEVLLFEYDLRNNERLGFGKTAVRLAPDSLFLSSNHQVVVT